jgi:lantibiotic biosynthesis protein
MLEGLLDNCATAAMALTSEQRDSTNVVALADLAQFLSHWGRVRGEQHGLDCAVLMASAAVDRLARNPLPPYWVGGFCGLTWSLRDSVYPPARTVQFSEAVDDALQSALGEPDWSGHYDLICGLSGFGVYGTEHPDPDRGACLATAVVRHLSRLARSAANGCTWWTSPTLLPPHQRRRLPNGCHNLGLAHGVPGVLAFLARCVELGVGGERAMELLDGGIRWLVAQREQNAVRSGYHFRNVVEAPSESRPLAWCYGDLGVSLALYRAGRVLASDSLRQLAFRVARDSAERDFDSDSVVDAGLCHGAAGAALVFHRFWQLSGESTFLYARDGWLKRILSLTDHELHQSAGVFTLESNGKDLSRRPSLDRLTGAAGVGLALMTCLDELDARWDVPLMTDIQGSGEACR